MVNAADICGYWTASKLPRGDVPLVAELTLYGKFWKSLSFYFIVGSIQQLRAVTKMMLAGRRNFLTPKPRGECF